MAFAFAALGEPGREAFGETSRSEAVAGFDAAVGDGKCVVEIGGIGEIAHAELVKPIERAGLFVALDDDVDGELLRVHASILASVARSLRQAGASHRLKIDGAKEAEVDCMRKQLSAALLSLIMSGFGGGMACAQAKQGLPAPTERRVIYSETADAKAEIAEALETAKKSHKRVILVFGGNWCYDCHALDTAFRSAEIAPIVNKNFVVVHVNIGEYDKNLDLAQKYDVPLKRGVPASAVLDSNGALLYSQKNGEFESAKRISKEDVVAFLEKWKPRGS